MQEEKTMSHRYGRRYSKRELLGSLHVDFVMSVKDLGLAPGANRWDVLRAFLAVGEARAERLIEEDGGFLVLQSVPGRPNTGAIYTYIERLQAFFWLRFERKEDDLNGDDFQNALRIYHLLDFVKGNYRPHRSQPRDRGRERPGRDTTLTGEGAGRLLVAQTAA
jgi:hypothetical protein